MAKHVRAKNLDDQDITNIVAILDGWTGKLTWDLFLAAIQKRLRLNYTRQALNNHPRITEAFRSLQKKKRSELSPASGHVPVSATSPELDATLQRMHLLEAENERLTTENNRLLEQFVRWAYNAYARGLDKAFLDQPLPTVHRDRTKTTMEELSRRRK